MTDDMTAVLTVQHSDPTKFEDDMTDLVRRGYAPVSSGYDGVSRRWWAVMFNASIAYDISNGVV